VLITVCTKNRQPWLAAPEVHEILISIWKEATAWLVGRYVIMPDHIHLFASPRDETVSLESWVRYWKSQFSKRHKTQTIVGKSVIGTQLYAVMKVTMRNGIMCATTLFGTVWSPALKIGRIRAKYLCWSGNLWVHLEGRAPARPKIF
jgi:REP element-mobilizing transposase RayT